MLKSEIVSEKKYLEGNEFGIYGSAKVDVDTSILDERIRKLLKDRELFRNLGVKLRGSLCDVLTYVSAQPLVFLDLAKNCSFMNRKHAISI